ncbi:MAG: acyl-CoA thioesterase [Candidatus Dormibacteraeota bacterium]|nr:acyl-CoA thioesterase [Candidatus Dormibacteraeota bacterium]
MTPLTPGHNPARITLRRLVEYSDTDASGHYHNGAVVRWSEAAEAVLHARLGIAKRTFGFTPRVRLEVDFRERLYFLDDIDINLDVVHVGRTSLRYGFEVRRGQTIAVTGQLVCAYLPSDAEHAQPWPDDIRRALTGGGDRTAQ